MANGDTKPGNNENRKRNSDIDAANTWMERYDKEHTNEKKKVYDSARLGERSSGSSENTHSGHVPLAAIFSQSYADLLSKGQALLGNTILGKPAGEISSMEEWQMDTKEAKSLSASVESQLSKIAEDKAPLSLYSTVEKLTPVVEELIQFEKLVEKLKNTVATVRGKCTEASEYINKHSGEMVEIGTFKIAREFVNCFEKVNGDVLDSERYLGKGKANLTGLENWSKTITNDGKALTEKSKQLEEYLEARSDLQKVMKTATKTLTDILEKYNLRRGETKYIGNFTSIKVFEDNLKNINNSFRIAQEQLDTSTAATEELLNASDDLKLLYESLPKKFEDFQKYLDARSKLENSLMTMQKEIIKGISYNKLLDKLQEGGYSEIPNRPFKMHEVVDDKEIQKVVADAKKRIQQDAETPQSLLNEYRELDVRREPLSERLQSFEEYLRKTVLDEYNNFEAKKNELNKIVDELKDIGKVQVNIDEATIGKIQLFWSNHGLNLTFDKNLGMTLKTQDIPPLPGTLDRGLYNLIHTRHQFWNVDLLKAHCDYHVNALRKTANLAENIQNNGIEYYGKQKEDLQIYKGALDEFRKNLIEKEKRYGEWYKENNQKLQISIQDLEEQHKKCITLKEAINQYNNEIIKYDISISLNIAFNEMDISNAKNTKFAYRREHGKAFNKMFRAHLEIPTPFGTSEHYSSFYLESHMQDYTPHPSLVHIQQKEHGECAIICTLMVLSSQNIEYFNSEELRKKVYDKFEEVHIARTGEPYDKTKGVSLATATDALNIFHSIHYTVANITTPDQLKRVIGHTDSVYGRRLPIIAGWWRPTIEPWEEGIIGHVVVIDRVETTSDGEVWVGLLDPAQPKPHRLKWNQFERIFEGRVALPSVYMDGSKIAEELPEIYPHQRKIDFNVSQLPSHLEQDNYREDIVAEMDLNRNSSLQVAEYLSNPGAVSAQHAKTAQSYYGNMIQRLRDEVSKWNNFGDAERKKLANQSGQSIDQLNNYYEEIRKNIRYDEE